MRTSQKLHQHACELTTKNVIDEFIESHPTKFPWLKKQFLKFYTVNPNLPWTDEYLKSQAEIRDEQVKHLNIYPWTIHPLSSFSLYWNTFMIFVYVFLYEEIPIRYFEILQEKPLSNLKINIAFVLSLIYLFDIIVHILRGRISSEGNLLNVSLLKLIIANWICTLLF